ncbi:MAG: septum site-determining protein MinD [Firmicutes bacterium]|nr:septum site-determining protein MinD [Bacillota bacterium]
MGEVLVVTSGKGGVGKTTAVANIGTALAALGKKVCLIDADIGLRNLDVVLGLENRIVYDLVDVVDGICEWRKALIRDKRFEGLHLLPAAQTKDKTAVNPAQMKALCGELAGDFDYVVVDCPAGIEQGFRNAIAGANRALIVSTPEVAAVRDADRVVGLLEAEGFQGPKLVINRLRPAMVRRGDMMDIDDMIEILAIELLGVVPEDEKIVVSTNRGEPASADLSCRAGQAYRNIARRLEGEMVPLMSLDIEAGFFNRLVKRLFRNGTNG